VKVNADAAVSKHSNRGVATAVCRDGNGLFLGASALAVPGISDPATLEAISCREGLSLAFVSVASDCLEVLNAIRDRSKCSYYFILREISQRRSEFTQVKFCHEKRCYNFHAHNLARWSISLDHGRHLWLLNSPDITIVPMCIE
jgi:hypothetical protein